jgi:hypothetical protein
MLNSYLWYMGVPKGGEGLVLKLTINGTIMIHIN